MCDTCKIEIAPMRPTYPKALPGVSKFSNLVTYLYTESEFTNEIYVLLLLPTLNLLFIVCKFSTGTEVVQSCLLDAAFVLVVLVRPYEY
eukprot:SAG31_NODE_9178_length_1320_cov_2.370188_1_plen_89_part_00